MKFFQSIFIVDWSIWCNIPISFTFGVFDRLSHIFFKQISLREISDLQKMNEEDKKAVEFLRENAKDLLTEKYNRDFNLLRWAQVSKYLELFKAISDF